MFNKPIKERKVGVNFLMEKYKRLENHRNRRNGGLAKSQDGRLKPNISPQQTDGKFSTMGHTTCAQTTTNAEGFRNSGQTFNFS